MWGRRPKSPFMIFDQERQIYPGARGACRPLETLGFEEYAAHEGVTGGRPFAFTERAPPSTELPPLEPRPPIPDRYFT
jgi:hypothetical protein